jgi:hypothetical protein
MNGYTTAAGWSGGWLYLLPMTPSGKPTAKPDASN